MDGKVLVFVDNKLELWLLITGRICDFLQRALITEAAIAHGSLHQL